jgi:O-antigen ligase
VGTGDVSTELKKEFKNLGYSYGYYEDLNAHNQFIEIQLENGIIGLVLFLILLGYMIYIAVSQGNLVYGLFILMMIIFFSFETMLNRLAGVTFFPLFAFLLYYLKNPQKT